MLVQDELTIREQAIHQIKLIYAAGRLVVYCLRDKFESIGQLLDTVYTEV